MGSGKGECECRSFGCAQDDRFLGMGERTGNGSGKGKCECRSFGCAQDDRFLGWLGGEQATVSAKAKADPSAALRMTDFWGWVKDEHERIAKLRGRR